MGGSLLLALIAVAGLVYWFGYRDPPPTEEVAAPATGTAEPSPVRVSVLPVVAQQMSSKLTLRGRTAASREVLLSSETAGRVISQPKQRGDNVSAGEVLCELHPGSRPAQLAEAMAALARAEVQAAATDTLQQRGFAAETTQKARAAELEAAKSLVEQVRWEIGQLKIVAPFDGVLNSDAAETGTFLSRGNPCASVIDLSRIVVSGFVGEQSVDKLRLGQNAKANLINGIEATGEITMVSRVADEATRTYTVEVTIDNPDGTIRDGMTTELLIELPERRAHLIPQSALTLNDAGEVGVRLADGDEARFVTVGILRDEGEGVWVSGLPDTADVIVIGQEFVRDGRRIIADPIDAGAMR